MHAHRMFIMKDRELDIIRRTILELLAKGCVHYTDLQESVCHMLPIRNNKHLQIAAQLPAKQ